MELSFGQRIDPQNGLVELWLTHDSLDRIKGMDLSDKSVLMYGAGLGDAWLAKRCKKLFVIERNPEWIIKASQAVGLNGINNIEYISRPCNDCSGHDEFYTAMPEGCEPDVVINDDSYRYEVIVKALTLKRPLTLIVDNWQQDYVFICPAAEELLKDFKQELHIQADHKDHEGRPWCTAIFYLT